MQKPVDPIWVMAPSNWYYHDFLRRYNIKSGITRYLMASEDNLRGRKGTLLVLIPHEIRRLDRIIGMANLRGMKIVSEEEFVNEFKPNNHHELNGRA